MFTWGTSQIDWPLLMDKGYCFDLSASKALKDTIGRMHPKIAELAIRNGNLYAIPSDVNFIYLQIEEDNWFEAGLSLDDVPKSFPDLLDFLDHWCDRMEDEFEPVFRIIGERDSYYTEYSYVTWLTRLLVDEAIMQMQYAGEALHFDSPELLVLLERCDTVGRRLYQLESSSGNLCLFDQAARGVWPTKSANIVYLPLNNIQPKLIKTLVMMWAIGSYTDKPDLCMELLEYVSSGVGNPYFPSDMFLFRDTQARVNPDYETELAYWTGEVNTVAEQLQEPNLNEDERTVLEETLIRYKGAVDNTEQNKWLMNPAQLMDYQASIDTLFFPVPNIFDESNSQGEIENLYNRFASRILTTEQFIRELNRIAQMIRLEGE